MQINATFKADLASLSFKHNEGSGARTVAIGLKTKVPQEKAASLLGEEFEALAFGSMSIQEGADGEQSHNYGYDQIKPSGIFEGHSLAIGSLKGLSTQPKIKTVTPAEDAATPTVIVNLECLIAYDNATTAGELATSLGKVVTVKLKPSQGQLFDGKAKARAPVVVKGGFGNQQPTLA